MKRNALVVILMISLVILANLFTGCSDGTTSTTSNSTSSTSTGSKNEITLKKGWTMQDAISADEVAAIVGKSVSYFPEASSAAQDGKPAGSYTINGVDNSKIAFYAWVNGGSSEFDKTRGFAVKDSAKDVSGIGDKAYICDLSNGRCAIVVLKGETVVKVEWNPATVSGDKVENGKKLAGKLIENMYK